MTKQKSQKKKLTETEARLIEQLRRHPQMMERVQSILEIARNEDGPLKTADEVEAMLVEEMRRLGHTTMSQWAVRAQERVSTELQDRHPPVLSRKKKTLKWWCVFGLIEVQERIWCSPTQSYLRPLPSRLGVNPRGAFSSAGSSADGFWL